MDIRNILTRDFFVLCFLLILVLSLASSEDPSCLLEAGTQGIYWTSPGFGSEQGYPAGSHCRIGASSESPHQTLLTFNSFHLQKKKRKCKDVVVFDLPNSRQMELCGQQDGVQRVPNYRLKGVFVSDKSKTAPGFNITIKAVKTDCHRIIDHTSDNQTEGVITSPRYPKKFPKFAQCEWWIKAPEERTIQLTIEQVVLKRTKNCMNAYLSVDYTGDRSYPSATSEIFCGKISETTVINSTGNYLNVAFNGGNKRMKGFKALYKVM